MGLIGCELVVEKASVDHHRETIGAYDSGFDDHVFDDSLFILK